MAEIRVEKKTPKWPWIIIILIIAVVAFLYFYGSSNTTDDNDSMEMDNTEEVSFLKVNNQSQIV